MTPYETEITLPITVWYDLDGKDPIIFSIEGVKITKEIREELKKEIISDLIRQGEQARLEMKLELMG